MWKVEKKEEKTQPAGTGETLWVDARTLSEEDFADLLDMLDGYPGELTAKILHGGKRFEAGVRLSRALIAELRAFLPESCIKVV